MLKNRKVPILDEKMGSGSNSVKLHTVIRSLLEKCLPVVLVLFARLQRPGSVRARHAWPGVPCLLGQSEATCGTHRSSCSATETEGAARGTCPARRQLRSHGSLSVPAGSSRGSGEEPGQPWAVSTGPCCTERDRTASHSACTGTAQRGVKKDVQRNFTAASVRELKWLFKRRKNEEVDNKTN